LLIRLALPVSDDTVLRRVKQLPVEAHALGTIRNLGVDDWAWRKAQNYGTILVDLDLHCVADLLADRSSESFSSWLQEHPGIVTISRDRCGLYAEGARIGAPDAQQVADRFHLILNLSSAVERVFEERTRDLLLPPVAEPDVTGAEARSESSSAQQIPMTVPATLQEERRQRRLERYNKVIELFTAGHSQKAISRELGIQTKTIRRWLRAGQFAERKPAHRRPARVTAFAEYLEKRWTEGCHNATRLYQEIRQKGYTGKRSMRDSCPAGAQRGSRGRRRLRNGLHRDTQPFSRRALRIKSRKISRPCSTGLQSNVRTRFIFAIRHSISGGRCRVRNRGRWRYGLNSRSGVGSVLSSGSPTAYRRTRTPSPRQSKRPGALVRSKDRSTG
jgi:hypothetical protein